MLSALALTMMVSTAAPAELALQPSTQLYQTASPWPPEVNAAIDSFGGVFCPPMSALGYYRGGPKAQQRGFWVGTGQVGLDLAVMTAAFVVGNGTDFGCNGFECSGPGGPGLTSAIAAYLVVNTLYGAWSAYDAYWTVKQDPPLSTPGPIR